VRMLTSKQPIIVSVLIDSSSHFDRANFSAVTYSDAGTRTKPHPSSSLPTGVEDGP